MQNLSFIPASEYKTAMTDNSETVEPDSPNRKDNASEERLTQKVMESDYAETYSVQATQQRLTEHEDLNGNSMTGSHAEIKKGGNGRFLTALWLLLGSWVAGLLSIAGENGFFDNDYPYSSETSGAASLFLLVATALIITAIVFVFVGFTERSRRAEYDFERTVEANQLLKAIAEKVGAEIYAKSDDTPVSQAEIAQVEASDNETTEEETTHPETTSLDRP